jgi:hypothetical protein
MATAVKVRTDFSAAELRRLAAASKHANQSRRLLSIAAVLDGMSRADAARIGGMDRGRGCGELSIVRARCSTSSCSRAGIGSQP